MTGRVERRSANERRVIVSRHHGWESASPSLLARVFGSTPQKIAAICRERCATCGSPICGCTDDQWLDRTDARLQPPQHAPGGDSERDGGGQSHVEFDK